MLKSLQGGSSGGATPEVLAAVYIPHLRATTIAVFYMGFKFYIAGFKFYIVGFIFLFFYFYSIANTNNF